LVLTSEFFAQPLHDFRHSPTAEEDQSDGKNGQPMKNTEIVYDAGVKVIMERLD